MSMTVIQAVDPRSPAHRAGLRVGETLTQINGHQIVDVLEATFQEFGYLDTDLSGQEVYQELINTEDMIVSKTDDSVNGFTTAYGPEIFASKESPSGDDFYSIQMYAPGYYTSVE